MNFFTHLFLGVLVALPFAIQFKAHRKLFLFIGALFGVLPDIDYILGGFAINRIYAGDYVGKYEPFISPEIRAKVIDFLNDGLIEQSITTDLNLQHRGITHDLLTVLLFAIGMGIIYLWFKKRSSDHAKPWALLSLIATLAWTIHIIADFGFTGYTWSGRTKDTIYGVFYTLPKTTINNIDIISFLILLSLVITYIYSKKSRSHASKFSKSKIKFKSQS